MSEEEENDPTIYRVVLVEMNGTEQYSIWPAERKLPAGSRDVGKSGTKAECMDYIADRWTDFWPGSLHRQLKKTGGNPEAGQK